MDLHDWQAIFTCFCCKGAFTNYVDKFLALLDHLHPYLEIFYLIKVEKSQKFWTTYPLLLDNVVFEHHFSKSLQIFTEYFVNLFSISFVLQLGPKSWIILEPVCCKNGRKSPNQETGLGNRGFLKVLNDTKLVLNEHKWLPYLFRINLVSFTTFRNPLFPKPVSCPGLFLPLLTARVL